MEKYKLPLPTAGAWSFKRPEVAANFDHHVREQLPWYDLATGVIAHLARHYVPEGGVVIDVGASTGNIGRSIGEVVSQRDATLIAIDSSADMVRVYDGPGSARVADARSFDFAAEAPDLIVAFLVMMFVPVADRAALVERMRAAVRPGGAVVIFDKMAGSGGHLGSVVYRLTLAAKYEAGAMPDEIIRKELALAGVQRPMSAEELDGFSPIFRFGDFAGWLYERAAVGS